MRNKILSIVIIALMIQFLMPALALAEDLSAPYELPSNPLCAGITGELNGDGLINNYDAEVMIQMAKGLEAFSPCADLDLDGYISAGDISLLIKLYKIDLPAHPEIVAEIAEFKAEADAAKRADSSSDTCTLGDVNGDNMIDYKDEDLMMEMVKGLIPAAKSADLDGDGYISPGDISMVISAIKVTHNVDPVVTAEEKGNCDVPTAAIFYSKDNGVTFNDTIKVIKGDILTIKTVFSSGLNEYQYAFLDLDNGLGADIFMTKLNDLESVYNLEIKTDDNLTATVSIKTINGVFTDNVVLTGGKTFVINKGQVIINGGSNWTPGSFPSCEVVNYGEWSEPVDGKSTREITSKVPFDCILSDSQVTSLEKIVPAEPQVEENPEVNAQVLGEKIYADGTLLRAINDFKIYVIENGSKRHVTTLSELAAKYFGQTIVSVTAEVLAQYPTIK